MVHLWHKVGGFFKMDFLTFNRQPWWAIVQVSKLLDHKASDMGEFLSSEEAAMFKNLRRMFGKKEDSE